MSSPTKQFSIHTYLPPRPSDTRLHIYVLIYVYINKLPDEFQGFYDLSLRLTVRLYVYVHLIFLFELVRWFVHYGLFYSDMAALKTPILNI